MIDIANTLISLLPVLVFLVTLVFLDSFKLVGLKTVIQGGVYGAAVAVACYFINGWLFEHWPYSQDAYERYPVPFIEELLKSLFVIFLIRTARIGFIVDAAICGFVVGTGFSLVENIVYLREWDANIFTWIVRGFGTAIMHGSTMAIFGILAKGLSERRSSMSVPIFLPGFLVAFIIHSAYNHVASIITTAVLLAVLPFLVILVFERSERATRRWLGVGFDTDVELLETLNSGKVTESHVGQYLNSLKSAFPGKVVGDMLCLLQIHLELSVRAKGVLMVREAGLKLPVDETVRANLEELKFLEKSIGTTGRLAMTPFLNMTSRDLWQLYMLGK